VNNQVRILLVEDEFITLETLSEYLEKSGYQIAGDAMNADEAIAVLDQGETDIAILDINIQGDRDGIWVADYIREHCDIPYIFLTAYGDQATIAKAIKTQPYGYLVKPFSEMDLYGAIEVALSNFAKEKRDQKDQAESPVEQVQIKDAIYLKQESAFIKILLEEITYVASDRNYLDVFTKEKSFIARSTLKEILPVLPQHFMQIHRSYIVNLKMVDKFGNNFIEINGREIPVGKSYRNELFQRFQKF